MKTCQFVILSPQPLRQQPHPSQLLEAVPCHGAAQRAVVRVVLQQEVLAAVGRIHQEMLVEWQVKHDKNGGFMRYSWDLMRFDEMNEIL